MSKFEGTVYSDTFGNVHIFLGYISYLDLSYPIQESLNDLPKFKKKKKRAMLWFFAGSNLPDTYETITRLNKHLDVSENYASFRVKIKTSHTMRKKIGEIQCENSLIFSLRNRHYYIFREYLDRNSRNWINTYVNSADLLTMVPYGLEPMDNLFPEYRDLLQ